MSGVVNLIKHNSLEEGLRKAKLHSYKNEYHHFFSTVELQKSDEEFIKSAESDLIFF